MDTARMWSALAEPLASFDFWANVRSEMVSSLNQKMGPRDCNYFLRTESEGGKEWKVLVDEAGPGCITRFWTAGDFDGELEIILDGAKQPLLRTTLSRFFAGEEDPFRKPLVSDHRESSGGRVSYWPILYAKSCKIRVSCQTDSLYWQVNHLKLPPHPEVRSSKLPLSEEERAMAASLRNEWDRKPDSEGLVFDRLTLPPREESVLFLTEGPGVVRELIVEAERLEPLRSLVLKAYWDGADEPAIDVPLLHLFCQGSKDRPFQSLYAVRTARTLRFAMPMPFAAGGSLRLYNPLKTEVPLRFAVRTEVAAPHTNYRFHCKYRRQVIPYGTLYPLLHVKGEGLFVGMNQVMKQLGAPKHMHFHQEGNEYMYVDQYATANWLGTGTEDYYNCGYYYREGETSSAAHGCLDLQDDRHGSRPAGLVSAYRFHLLDAVPFRTSLLLAQEAGCPKKGVIANVNGKEWLDYQWTCYWYQSTSAERSASSEALRLSE
ncbi:DUF2961 domain-containing protein [Paenibacillus antri]|uniref:DUF2961 domain-containing protein n=1 Tax=Paenibacillus antri TaxID=2582848 RepID=A0A5R9GBH2_9BACL|nr:DUF2961 domain-containing protein [Paenibacillus antri]TLS53807.1 DUF2961 domain-containing protein [Paenibacillus antri]